MNNKGPRSESSKLDMILSMLEDTNKRLARLERQQRPLPHKPSLNIPEDCGSFDENKDNSEAIATTKKGHEVIQKLVETTTSKEFSIQQGKGKYFDDQQRTFLALQLEEVLVFLRSLPCKDKQTKELQVQNLKAVLSALKGNI